MSDTTNNTSFMLAPGEQNVCGDQFMVSPVAPYLKAELMCSSTRFVYKVPNVILGFIPVGSAENQVPLANIASVSSSSSFKPGKFLLGLVLCFAGLASLPSQFFFGAMLLFLGVCTLLTAFPSSMTVVNPAGGKERLSVSILEAKKLKVFVQELQNRIFADKDQLRHDEAQMQRMMQTQLQQMQLQQMQQMNNKQE